MLKKLTSVLAVMLVIAIMFSSGLSKVLAVSINGTLDTVVYIDGVKFVITDTEDRVIVKAEGESSNFKMYLFDNGTAYAEGKDENGKDTKVWLNINELSEDKVDIDLKTEDGTVTKLTSLNEDEYEGQMAATITYGGIAIYSAILWALAALLVTSAVVYIAGEAYQALDYALRKSRLSYNKYYKAHIYNNSVFITKDSISKNSAIARVGLGRDVYTYKSSDARRVAVAITGLVKGPEIDKQTKSSGALKKGIYYYHYHTWPKNGAHVFYGNAYVYN